MHQGANTDDSSQENKDAILDALTTGDVDALQELLEGMAQEMVEEYAQDMVEDMVEDALGLDSDGEDGDGVDGDGEDGDGEDGDGDGDGEDGDGNAASDQHGVRAGGDGDGVDTDVQNQAAAHAAVAEQQIAQAQQQVYGRAATTQQVAAMTKKKRKAWNKLVKKNKEAFDDALSAIQESARNAAAAADAGAEAAAEAANAGTGVEAHRHRQRKALDLTSHHAAEHAMELNARGLAALARRVERLKWYLERLPDYEKCVLERQKKKHALAWGRMVDSPATFCEPVPFNAIRAQRSQEGRLESDGQVAAVCGRSARPCGYAMTATFFTHAHGATHTLHFTPIPFLGLQVDSSEEEAQEGAQIHDQGQSQA